MFSYYGTGDEPIEMTAMRDVANFTAEVAVDPKANGFLNGEESHVDVKSVTNLCSSGGQKVCQGTGWYLREGIRSKASSSAEGFFGRSLQQDAIYL